MATAAFDERLALSTPAEAVWATITDVERLVGWVSILHGAREIERLARYSATLEDRLGPFKLRAELGITVEDVVAPHRLRVRARGEDRQVRSAIAVLADVWLEERSTGLDLCFAGQYEVTGKIATMGSGVIHDKARKIIGEFSESVRAELGVADGHAGAT